MKKLHATYKVKAEAGASEAEILIYDVIGEDTDWWTGEKFGISAINFLKDFRDLESKYNTIRIRINSIGGIVDEGLAIFNAIRYSAKDVHTHNESAAYSMSGVLMQAAKKGNRHAKKATRLMIHSATCLAFEYFNAAKAKEMLDALKTCDEVLAIAMTDSTGLSKDEILKKWFDGTDHYFTAEEALAAGLIDDIEDATAIEAIGNDYRIAAFSKYRIAALGGNANDEPGLLSKFKAMIENAIAPLRNQITQSQTQNTMTLEKLAAKFTGEAVNISADESKAFKALLDQFKDAKFTQAEVDQKVSAKETEMQAKVQEVQNKLDKATGTQSTSKDEDDITTGNEVKDDPITAKAKEIKAKNEKQQKGGYDFLKR